jgi:hypothetical protein
MHVCRPTHCKTQETLATLNFQQKQHWFLTINVAISFWPAVGPQGAVGLLLKTPLADHQEAQAADQPSIFTLPFLEGKPVPAGIPMDTNIILLYFVLNSNIRMCMPKRPISSSRIWKKACEAASIQQLLSCLFGPFWLPTC